MKDLKLYIFLFLLFLISQGCRKFVELDPPKTLLVTTNAFTDDATAISTITGVYAQMVNRDILPFRISVLTGLQADELKSANDSYITVYQNNLNPGKESPTNQMWLNAYNVIYQANAVYEGCEKSTTLSIGVKKQLMAEAMFIRAFWYFYLVNLYGDVPLITTTDYAANAVAARAPKEKVYQQIIADLQYAQTNLNEHYVAANSVSTTTDRVRPNKAGATALLARVYLYTNNYTAAATQASQVIDQHTVYEMESIGNTFLANSKEAIWQLMRPTSSDINTYEGYNYVLTSKPMAATETQSSTISLQLLDVFEGSDLRRTNWIGTISDATGTYYYPNKYKVRLASPVTEHSIVLRLAEQYLIRAEARAENDELAGAIDDIDVIRKRAGITLIKDEHPDISKVDLLTAILKERQTELFTEWGHRWLDLKRTGQIDAVMNVVTPLKGGVWKSTKQLWPIPETEIGNDVNLTPNPGYN